MPQKPLKACKYPGCPDVTDKRYCPKHAAIAVKEYNATHDPNFNQRYGRQWKKIRATYISKHPLCEECEGGWYRPKRFTIKFRWLPEAQTTKKTCKRSANPVIHGIR